MAPTTRLSSGSLKQDHRQNELAMKTYHLLGGQQGSTGPAVTVDMYRRFRLDLFADRCPRPKAAFACKADAKDVVMPCQSAHLGRPRGREARSCQDCIVDSTTFGGQSDLLCWGSRAMVLSCVCGGWAHKMAVLMTACLCEVWQLIAPCRAVGGKVGQTAVYRTSKVSHRIRHRRL